MEKTFIGLASAAFGFVSGLLVPWVKWEIEKRKKRYSYRKKMIEDWRKKLATADFVSEDGNGHFASSPEYSSLRAHMTKKIIDKFEAPRTFYATDGSRGDDLRKIMLLDEVSRIEKEWGLV